MRVDSKHRNVGFLALSGRCTVKSLTTAPSQKETFGLIGKDKMGFLSVPASVFTSSGNVFSVE